MRDENLGEALGALVDRLVVGELFGSRVVVRKSYSGSKWGRLIEVSFRGQGNLERLADVVRLRSDSPRHRTP